MKKKFLCKCLKKLGHLNDDDSKILDRLTSWPEPSIVKLVNSFRRELLFNVTNKTSQEKKEIVKTYVLEIERTAKLSETYREILFRLKLPEKFDGSLDMLFKIIEEFPLDPMDQIKHSFLHKIHSFYILLFEEIQEVCNASDIPFIEICNELDFNMILIDPKRTVENEEKKSLVSKISMETQIISNTTIANKPDYEQELNEIKHAENKFWLGLPMDFVVNHFIGMTIEKSKNGHPFLSPEQLISVLKRVFLLDRDQPRQRINCDFREKAFIISRYYQLYIKAVSLYGCEYEKERFINLVSDSFDNWKENNISSSFRAYAGKRKW
jgi:hypothetical protein